VNAAQSLAKSALVAGAASRQLSMSGLFRPASVTIVVLSLDADVIGRSITVAAHRCPSGGLPPLPINEPCCIGNAGRKHMKADFRPGVSRVIRLVVDRGRTISFMGEEGRTYATPSMILDIEQSCRDLIAEHADTGEDSVGTEVIVRHLAPTPMGMTVEIVVTVLSIEGRRVQFDVSVKDDLEAVGAGTHTRFVVDKAKTFERLKTKAARMAAQAKAP
jgi:predicted thioesterase